MKPIKMTDQWVMNLGHEFAPIIGPIFDPTSSSQQPDSFTTCLQYQFSLDF
jgi:hypothetical protein